MKQLKRSFKFKKDFMFSKRQYFLNELSNIKILKNRNIKKSFMLLIAVVILLTASLAWLYDEYVGSGASIKIGTINHLVTQYNSDGSVINDEGGNITIIYENNMSNATPNYKIIEIENNGTLDLEYSMSFMLEGTREAAGIMYYRLFEITGDINNITPGAGQTKVEAYTVANPVTPDIETDTANPISNLSLLHRRVQIGDVLEGEKAYFRLDYGIYSGVNTSLYSGESLSVHMNVYSSQTGVITQESSVGQVYEVSTEAELREKIATALSGDTIKLVDSIKVNGSLNINRRLNLDTNGKTLEVTGDLIIEYVNMGDALYDISGTGKLEVGNNLYINTPKANIHFLGENGNYDVVVGNTFTLNCDQQETIDGVYFENIRFVKSKTSLVPVDLNVMSNSRVTIGQDVVFGSLKSVPGSTNIEVINNGNIVELDFSEMTLLDTFSKYQIYVYNLGEITGVVGRSSIILPPTATPYLGPNDGNTLIIRGITSGDLTIEGSEHFDAGDIENTDENTTVVPIRDEEDAYIVYIKEPTVSVESLLRDYFTLIQEDDDIKIAQIKKLVIYTLNAQYVEQEDFTFFKSDMIPNIRYLDLSNSRITDGTTNNIMPAYALYNKTSLKTVILSKTITSIGDYAFYNVELGKISADSQFSFLTIPTNVVQIGNNVFNITEYVKFANPIPPEMTNTSFGSITKAFVPNGSIESYQDTNKLNNTYIFRNANLSDDGRYFVYETTQGLGIAYIVNNYITSATLGVPNTIPYLGSNILVDEIGQNSYRNANLTYTPGVTLSLPNTIKVIDKYAFYNLNLVSANFDNTTIIDDYAFYNTKLKILTAYNLLEIGDYAFTNSTLEKVNLNNNRKIGTSAFANNTSLYVVNSGRTNIFMDNAFYNCPNIQKFYFGVTDSLIVNETEEINITAGENALFNSWGSYISNRLRVYVPDLKSSISDLELVDLYKNKFNSKSRYIYRKGIEIGSYTHMAVPEPINEYTIKEVTLLTAAGTSKTGYEIISYQGKNLTDDIPSSLTYNSTTRDVIKIGDYAYYNSTVANSTGIGLVNDNLISVGSYAFANLKLNKAVLNGVVDVQNHAFINSEIYYGYFNSIKYIGDYAFCNNPKLYQLRLGNIEHLGEYSLANLNNLTSIYMLNESKNINVAGTALNNVGISLQNRFRMYVPVADDQVEYYKTIFVELSNYIYPTGIIIGSYYHPGIDLDIGEYSIRPITRKNKDNQMIDGYEIVEYHGANLNSTFTIPEEVSTNSSALVVNTEVLSSTAWHEEVKISLTNTSEESINGWSFDLEMPPNTTYVNYFNGRYSVNGNIVTIMPTTNNSNALIEAGATIFFTVEFTNMDFALNGVYPISNIQIDSGPTSYQYRIISVGDNAFRHALSENDALYNINSERLLYLGKYSLANLRGLGSVELPNVVTLEEGSFFNTTITKGVFTNLETIKTKALADTPRLYYLNLGTVVNMETLSVTNAPQLYQVLFQPKNNNPTLVFSATGFVNVGTVTNDRIRFYVTNETNINGVPFVDIYSGYFTEYKDYFYAYDYIVGSYTPSGLPTYVDIGVYSVKSVSIRDVDNNVHLGYEFVEYHGPDITNTYIFPTTTAQGQPIIKIGNNAFRHASFSMAYDGITLSSEELLEIGHHAFYNKEYSLYEVNLPNVFKIGEYAFSGTKMKIGRFINLEEAGQYAFSHNQSLVIIDLGNLGYLQTGLLYNNNNIALFYMRTLKQLLIEPNAITNVGINAGNRFRLYVKNDLNDAGQDNIEYFKTIFNDYSSYVFELGHMVGSYVFNTVDIGAYTVSPKEEGANTGWNLVEYHGIDIDDSFDFPVTLTINEQTALLISIGDYAFSLVSVANGFSWDILLPSSITYVGNYAFYKRNFTQVSGSNLTYIGKYAFAETSTLLSVNFATVTYIDEYAFYRNTALKMVKLGTNVEEIGNFAFYNSWVDRSLTAFYIDTLVPPTIYANTLPARHPTSNNDRFLTIYVGRLVVTDYQSAPYWQDYYIRRSTDVYNNMYFYEILSSNEVKITAYIGNSAQPVIIPTYFDLDSGTYTVTAIAPDAFDSTTKTRFLTIPPYVNDLGNGFLQGNVSVRYIYVSMFNTNYSSYDGVLYDYNYETLIRYPRGKTSSSYELHSNTKIISSGAFKNCTNLRTLYIPSNVLAISNHAFDGASSLNRYYFYGYTEPYLTGYDTFPFNGGLRLYYPDGSYNNYNNNVYYQKYSSYLYSW